MSAASASIPVDSKWSIRRSCCLRRAALAKAAGFICELFVSGSLWHWQWSFLVIFLSCWKITHRLLFVMDSGTFASPWSCRGYVWAPVSNIEAWAIKPVFLPPNTTAILQPCEQGIISSLKCHYQKEVNKLLLRQIDEGGSSTDFTVFLVTWYEQALGFMPCCYSRDNFKLFQEGSNVFTRRWSQTIVLWTSVKMH